ncbi:MAG: hypothetical protein JO117_06570 [Verrucomicrobia bacterium]|nr:hypothetical protein [Verrucomicrobiota bacterium]
MNGDFVFLKRASQAVAFVSDCAETVTSTVGRLFAVGMSAADEVIGDFTRQKTFPMP